MSHFVKQCSCGKVIAQCRCISPNKKVEIFKNACNDCKQKDKPYHQMFENNLENDLGDRKRNGLQAITILFDDDSTHNSILQEVVQKLEFNGFASAKEIKEEWLNLLGVENEK